MNTKIFFVLIVTFTFVIHDLNGSPIPDSNSNPGDGINKESKLMPTGDSDDSGNSDLTGNDGENRTPQSFSDSSEIECGENCLINQDNSQDGDVKDGDLKEKDDLSSLGDSDQADNQNDVNEIGSVDNEDEGENQDDKYNANIDSFNNDATDQSIDNVQSYSSDSAAIECGEYCPVINPDNADGGDVKDDVPKEKDGSSSLGDSDPTESEIGSVNNEGENQDDKNNVNIDSFNNTPIEQSIDNTQSYSSDSSEIECGEFCVINQDNSESGDAKEKADLSSFGDKEQADIFNQNACDNDSGVDSSMIGFSDLLEQNFQDATENFVNIGEEKAIEVADSFTEAVE